MVAQNTYQTPCPRCGAPAGRLCVRYDAATRQLAPSTGVCVARAVAAHTAAHAARVAAAADAAELERARRVVRRAELRRLVVEGRV